MAIDRETWRKAGWSALTLAMFLAFLEILALRTDPGAEHPHIAMNFDADLMWGLTNASRQGPEHRVNALGLRGDDLGEKRGPRLLTLGDSSIYGHGVAIPEVFSSVVAARLDGAVQPVIGAVPGYSSFQSRRLFARVREAVAPDVVVIGNLWSDSTMAGIADHVWAEELAAAYGPWRPIVGPLALLSERSALARRLRTTIHDAFFPGREHANEVGWTHLVPPDPTKPGAGVTRRGASLPTARVPLPQYRANLEALVAAAREAGAEPVFLMLPHPYDGIGLPAHETSYRAVMREVAAAVGAPLVDGPAAFAGRPGPLFSDDIHPNAAGHAILAEATLLALRTDPEVAARLGL